MADEPQEKEQTLDDIAAASVDQGFEAANEPPAETPAPEPAAAASAPQTPESGTQPPLSDTGGQQTPPAEEHAPPHHWSAEDQTTFRGMAPEAKGFVLDRIKAMEAAHTQRSQEIAPMRQVLQKHQTYADMLGMTPHDMVDALVETERVLRQGTREQKVQLLLQMAHDYGITDQDFQGAAQGQTQPEAGADDPFGIQKAVQDAVNPLRERLDTFQTTTEQQRLQQEQAYQEQGRQALERFRTETDEQGNAKRPYWNEVLPTMEALAQVAGKAGVPKDIPTLYDEACRAHPEVWAKIQAAEEHKAQLAAQANGATQARRQVAANGGLAGGGGSPPTPGSMDLDAAIDDAWEKSQAGV